MSERAQALEAAMRKIRAHTSYNPAAGRAFLAELLASVERIADAALLAVQPPPPVGSPTTEDIPQLVQRFDLVSVSFAYTSDHEMERADDGEWVRFDDVFPPASLAPVEPTPEPPRCDCLICASGRYVMSAKGASGLDAVEPAPPTPAPCVLPLGNTPERLKR